MIILSESENRNIMMRKIGTSWKMSLFYSLPVNNLIGIFVILWTNSPNYYDIIGTDINWAPKIPPPINVTVGMDYIGLNYVG